MFPELSVPHPTPAIRSIPKWWNDMPRYFGEGADKVGPTHARHAELGTIRNCPAVSDVIGAGYTIYFPSDLYIDSTKERIEWDGPPFISGSRAEENFPYIMWHPKEALGGMKMGEEWHTDTLKVQTYWGIKTDAGYSTMFLPPTNRLDLPFQVVPAIVDTDVFPTHHPYAIYVKRGFKGVIHRGTPFMQLFPFKREDWTMSIEEFDSNEYLRILYRIKSTFTNPYKRIFWNRKKYT